MMNISVIIFSLTVIITREETSWECEIKPLSLYCYSDKYGYSFENYLNICCQETVFERIQRHFPNPFRLLKFKMLWSSKISSMTTGRWRPNVLVTSLRYRCRVSSLTSRVKHQRQITVINIILFECHQHVEKNMQHNCFIINMKKWSPALSNQHNDVTNIRFTSENRSD